MQTCYTDSKKKYTNERVAVLPLLQSQIVNMSVSLCINEDFKIICSGTNISSLQRANFGKNLSNSDGPLFQYVPGRKPCAEMLSIQSDISSQLEPIKLNVNYPVFFKGLFSGHSAGD